MKEVWSLMMKTLMNLAWRSEVGAAATAGEQSRTARPCGPAFD